MAALSHDYHWSNCTIEHNPWEKTLQISIHLFIDDLEEALRLEDIDQLFICTEREAPDAETHIHEYLKNKFKLSANAQEVELEWIGKEITDDLTGAWCYLQVSNIEEVAQLELSYKVFLELYDDQKNVLEVILPNKPKGYFIFSKNQSTEEFNF